MADVIDPLTGPKFVLEGHVVTMGDSFEELDPGRVYIDKGEIVAVADAAESPPEGFEDALLFRTRGTIYPGLIELHNHLSYDVLQLWQVPRKFENRGNWRDHDDKKRLISGPMKILGSTEMGIPAIVRYVEAKALLGGTTTSQGITLINKSTRHHYRGLVRNVENTEDEDLPDAGTRIADVSDPVSFLERLEKNDTLLLHLSEGIDDTARKHFKALKIEGRKWAITEALAGIHCAGLRNRDYATLRSRGGTMIWSPLSNLLLYGGTADVARAKQEEVLIALGSDWSPSGSKNLLGELKAAKLCSEELGSVFSDRELVAMATINPARILKWDQKLGRVAPGYRADLLILEGGDPSDPYGHLVRAREDDVLLVVINGVPRYGRTTIMNRFEGVEGKSEFREIGGKKRAFYFEQATVDELVASLSLAEAERRLVQGLGSIPELAVTMADPMAAASVIGVRSATMPGAWVLELDNETDDSIRPLAPGDVRSSLAGGPQPLVQELASVALDPLAAIDDEQFFQRLVNQANLPEYIWSQLPEFYGTKAPKRDPDLFETD